MTGQNLSTFIRASTKTDSVTFTDANILLRVNVAKDDICGKIAKRNSQYFVVPTTFNLVASSVTAREYSWPDDVMSRIQTIEVEFVSTNSPFKFVPVKPYPGGMQQLIDDIGGLTEANITANFSNSNPYYVKTRRGIFILSGTISAVTNGGKLRYQAFPADLANVSGSTDLSIDPSTTTFGIPKQVHQLLVDYVSLWYKGEHPGSVALTPRELKYEDNLEIVLREIAFDDFRDEIFGSTPTTNYSGDNNSGITGFPNTL